MSEARISSLDQYIQRRSPRERIRLHGRADAMAEFWALKLLHKHGEMGAQLRCRYRIVFCTRFAPGIRLQLWRMIWKRLNL